jgi:hypothetical protein
MNELRVSDAEREAVIDRLRLAAGEGRLTLEELSDRIGSAAAARTRGELEKTTSDLAVASASPAPDVAATRSVFGDIRRKGAWRVPRASRWRSFFGTIVIDLREAHVADPETTLELRSVFGDLELLVPEGVEVDVRCRTVFGDHRHDVPSGPSFGPRVVLTGGTVFGDVRVRSRRLRERIAAALLD